MRLLWHRRHRLLESGLYRDIVRRKKSLNIHSPITSGYNTASILPEWRRVKDNVKTKNLSAKGSRKEPRGVDMLCLRAR